MKPVEGVRVHRLVAVVPPDHVVGKRVLDGELVLRASAGVAAGAHDQRSVLRQQAFAAAHRMLDERRSLQIPEDLGASSNALRLKPAVRNPVSHANLSLSNGQTAAASGGCRRIRMHLSAL